MKLVGSSGSRKGNRAQTEKSIIDEFKLSESSLFDVEIPEIPDATPNIVEFPESPGTTQKTVETFDYPDTTQSIVGISELPDITQFLNQQQPVRKGTATKRPGTKEPVKVAAKESTTHGPAWQKMPGASVHKKVKPPATPQISAYPDVELTPAQKAAIQRVISKDKTQPVQGELTKLRQDPTANAVTQTQAPQKRKVKKKKRADIHAYSDRQLKKKRSVAKPLIITLLLVLVLGGGGLYGWYYWLTEHATFDYDLHPVVILSGQSVKADDFINSGGEMERVTAVFQNPGFKPQNGFQHVPLTLTQGLRTVEATITLHVMTTVDRISHEYRVEGFDLRAVDFIANLDAAAGVPFDVQFAEEPKQLEKYEVGEHILFLTLNGAPFEVLLTVEDTTPPSARAVDKFIVAGETVAPEEFVEDVYDPSGIKSIEFVEEPNFLSDRVQIVEIEVTDIYGNSAIFRGELTVHLNAEPPIIEGTDTIVSIKDNPILYLQGVTAVDDMGRELEVQVDSSGVDQYTVGEYKVIYFAVDATGLRSEVEETVHILDIDIEWLYARVDEALEDIRKDIRKDEITQLDMVKGIQIWVKRYLDYSGTRNDPVHDYEGAYRALRDKRGNCFTYYSLSAVMLTRAGIPNMPINRIPGTPTRHRWNLVNPDGLGWHHYDSTPLPSDLNFWSESAFFTASKAREVTRRYQSHDGRRDYYTYDITLYPDIVD